MSMREEDPRRELAAIAAELARHLRWAEARGERELPLPEDGAELHLEVPAAEATSARGSPPAQGARPGARLQGPPAAPAAGAPLGERSARAALEAAPPPRGAAWDPREAPPSPELGARPAAAPAAATGQAPTLGAIREAMGDCRRCKLCSSRTQIVFGDGNPRAELVFVGEGPGLEEDRQGLPFVGAAGQLLDRMIQAMGYQRREVYIANVVKCRPPHNRNPEPDEVEACEPFLREQLAAIRPKAIVALGKFAAQTLLRDPTPITRLRGSWRSYEGIPLMPTFHPAYLLRSPQEKGKAWADLQQVMALLGKPLPRR